MDASKNKEAINLTFFVAYSIILIIISYFLGDISITNYESSSLTWFYIVTQLTCFLALGVLHLYFLKRIFKSLVSSNILIYSLLLFLLIFLVLYFTYQIKNAALFALAGASAFILPTMLKSGWLLFTSAKQVTNSKQITKLWFNTFDSVKENKNVIYIDSISLKIKLSRNQSYNKGELYEVALSAVIPFGRLFEQFLVNLDGSNFIELKDERQKNLGWQFFVEEWSGLTLRPIDPYLSLRENNVKNNSTIVAKRVKVE